VHMSINSTVRPFGFAWTNLVKLDQHASRPTAEIEELVGKHFPVVPHELETHDPTSSCSSRVPTTTRD
jgi:hypothetical protein